MEENDVSIARIAERLAIAREEFAQPQRSARRSSQLHDEFIDVTPAPGLARFERRDDRVLRGMKMFARMPVLRVVTAAHVPAGSTQSQVHPGIAQLEALLATVRAGARLGGFDGRQMSALRTHSASLFCRTYHLTSMTAKHGSLHGTMRARFMAQ
jgi:hypothetical protein